MFHLKTFLCLILICLSTSVYAGDKILWKDDVHNCQTPKSQVLDKVLSHTKDVGYAGVVPICKINKKNYIMLSQERSNGNATGTYCDFGGKVDKGETIATAALRELYEESSKVYDLRDKQADFKKNLRACYSDTLLTAFIEVEYKKRQIFLDAAKREKQKPNNHHFCEKSDFIWVDVDHLYKSLGGIATNATTPSIDVRILNDDGSITNKTIKLRDFFAKTIKNSAEILAKYTTQATSSEVDLKIQTITSLKEISSANLKPKTLILLDLDENIILEKTHAPQKYQHLINPAANYRLIEKDISTTVHKLKSCINNDSANIVVLGLTKRGLKKHGRYDKGHKYLEQTKVPLSRLRFQKYNGKTLCDNNNAGFYNGVIHTAGRNKGHYLEDFLTITGFNPAHIIMADDQPQNLIDVFELAKKIGVTMDAYEMRGVDLLH